MKYGQIHIYFNRLFACNIVIRTQMIQNIYTIYLLKQFIKFLKFISVSSKAHISINMLITEKSFLLQMTNTFIYNKILMIFFRPLMEWNIELEEWHIACLSVRTHWHPRDRYGEPCNLKSGFPMISMKFPYKMMVHLCAILISLWCVMIGCVKENVHKFLGRAIFSLEDP